MRRLLLLCLCVSACGHKMIPPPQIERITETVEVKVPVPVVRVPPPELLAPLNPPLPLFVDPTQPDASSALTVDGERLLRALIEELLGRIDAWKTWAQETPTPTQ